MSDSDRPRRYNFVANYECQECGHARTMKTRVKMGKFDGDCPSCDEETTFGLTMEPMDIDQFGEELIER